ncbi:MAG: M20/M25/M40 family metallo-hydrolase [Anaerolineales bacterium]|jgi:acetylornithine deacetylase/succinyl-diaminopimelate desuccinylase-like protein
MSIPSPVEIAQRLIRFNTVNPPGDEQAAQEYLRDLLASAGFDVEFLTKQPGRPNLITRLTGTGARPPLLFYAHTDVVGTQGQQWDQPPFDAIIEDDLLYGRGALDMKAGVAMLVYALIQAKQDDLKPSGDILLAIVVDEETGGSQGMQFLLEQHSELFDGIQHAVGEFGGFPLYAFGKKFYRIGVSQKQYAHIQLRLTAPGGHGSLPTGETIMTKLGKALHTLDAAKMPYYKTELAEEIIRTICGQVPPAAQDTLLALLEPDTFEAALVDLGANSERFESLFRDTANATIVRSGSKFNVIPSEALVEIDARILPGRTAEDLLEEIRKLLGVHAEIEVLASGPTTKSQVDYELFDTLADILKSLDPEGIPIPYLFNESPDGRLLEAHGMQNYGFLPMNLPPEIDLPSLIHAENERVPVKSIEFGAQALFELLRRY